MRRHVIAHTNPLRMRVSYILICVVIYILIYHGFHGPSALGMHRGVDGCGNATNTTNTHGASTLCTMVHRPPSAVAAATEAAAELTIRSTIPKRSR